MKILFQGSMGAYSHLAALEVYPDAEIIPCKTFDECFSKANDDDKIRIIIPESNRITGNIGVEYLIFKYRLNIYMEKFYPINHHLIAAPGSKIQEIKNKLEQLRAMDNNININVALAESSPIGVDTKEDYMALKKNMEYKY